MAGSPKGPWEVEITSPLHPLSKAFSKKLFVDTFVTDKKDDIITNPEATVSYGIPEDGFVIITLSIPPTSDLAFGRVWGFVDDSGPQRMYFGSAVVQRNSEKGINVMEATATLPVRKGDSFFWLGGSSEPNYVFVTYRPFPEVA